jgi:hypothetical protein
LLVDKELLTEHAWVQIDSPRVPFARMFETKNWSARLVPPGRTVIGCECYCAPDASDAAWSLDDEALGAACARALVDPLGLVEDQSLIRPLEVIRLPRAWSLVEADAIEAAGAPLRWVGEIDGLRVAQGGDVVLAIAAGEQAAAS